MTRNKLNLSYITNDSMRKLAFNKRKNGLFKKIHELSVLCGIPACAVIYSPFSSTPEVWPSNSEVNNVMEKFKGIPEIEQEKRMVNPEEFLRQRITKIRENIIKKINDNKERAMKETMFQFLRGNGNMFQLTDKHRDDLCKYIDQYLKELYYHRNQNLNQSHLENGESSSAANAMIQQAAIAEEGSSSLPNSDAFNRAPKPIISPSQKLEPVDILQNNYPPLDSDQQGYYQMMNPQKFAGYPNVAQNGNYNETQNPMSDPNQVRFPTMDDNNCYYHHQP